MTRKSAHWIEERLMSYEWNCSYIYYKCSSCKQYSEKKHNYCPHCGAKMEEKER
jgi:predicted amidophosphoribosyltransferase